MRYKEIPDHEHPKIGTHIVKSKTDVEKELGDHKDDKNDPHEVTKTQVGLSNVDNTSDNDKPVSSAQQAALDLKADKSNVLELDNTNAFTPDADYEPATKKYVDDNGGADPNAIHDNVASEISAITEKTTLVDNDLFVIEDSADSNNKKRVKKSNLGAGGGSSKTWLHLTISADQTGVAAGSLVNFDEAKGDIAFNTTTHKMTLLSSKTYRLTVGLRMYGTSTGYALYKFYDYTNAAYLTGRGAAETYGITYSNNYNSTHNVMPIHSIIVTPASDIEVGVRIILFSNLSTIRNQSSWCYIEEK